jgi:DNA invertase Pin-like site-specific DNA recombinase
MKIGYARVSTDDQNPALQIAALKRAGCKLIFTDTAGGASRKRPHFWTDALNKGSGARTRDGRQSWA